MTFDAAFNASLVVIHRSDPLIPKEAAMKPLLFLLFLFALFFAAIVLQAQNTGTLEGCVSDTDGAGIPGARIEVVGTSRGAVSKPNGNYIVAGLRAGTYTIRIASLGKRKIDTTVTIVAQTTTTLNITLDDVGPDGQDAVIVIRSSELVEPTSTDSRPDFSRDDIAGQTTTTVFDAILRNASVSGGGLGVRGGRANEAVIRRDGSEVYNPVFGSTGQAIGTFPEVSADGEITLPVHENTFDTCTDSSHSNFSID